MSNILETSNLSGAIIGAGVCLLNVRAIIYIITSYIVWRLS